MRFHLFAYWHDSRWEGFVGATVKIWDLANNLAALGHDVTLFIPARAALPGGASHTAVRIPYLDLPGLRHLTFSASLAAVLLHRLCRAAPNAVYSRRMNSLLPGVYARLRRVPFLYEINDDPFAPPSPGASVVSQWRWHLQRRRDLLNLRWCTKAFVISPGLATRLTIACPDLDSNKLAILPSGANTELFAPLPPDRCRRELRLAPSGRYVGFVGTLLAHQGIDVLIDAAAEMDMPPGGCTFVIIGEGPMRGAWQEAAVRKGLGERFLFPGEVPYANVPTWLSAMDLCVAPYRRSAGLRSPVKIFDYLACGKPVVASQIPGTTDVFEDVPAVVLVPPEDASALAMAIAEILGDPNRSGTMSATARPFVQNGYDRRSLARSICDGLRDKVAAGRGDGKDKHR